MLLVMHVHVAFGAAAACAVASWARCTCLLTPQHAWPTDATEPRSVLRLRSACVRKQPLQGARGVGFRFSVGADPKNTAEATTFDEHTAPPPPARMDIPYLCRRLLALALVVVCRLAAACFASEETSGTLGVLHNSLSVKRVRSGLDSSPPMQRGRACTLCTAASLRKPRIRLHLQHVVSALRCSLGRSRPPGLAKPATSCQGQAPRLVFWSCVPFF